MKAAGSARKGPKTSARKKRSIAARTPADAINPARALAVDLLSRGEGAAPAALGRALTGSSLASEDRRLLAEIVLGTVRMRRRIEHLLSGLVDEKKELPPALRAVLHAGVYQILFLDRVPDYAAVNESVALARSFGHEGWARLANAVLRRAAREKDAPLALGDGDETARLGVLYSYPDWIVRRVRDEIGPAETPAFLEMGNAPAHVTLRVNARRTTRAALLARLEAEGIEAVPSRYASRGIRIPARTFVAGLGALREGLASVQDESALLVSDLLAPAAGETIADLCAAPGGKALAIAEIAGEGTRVIAVDRDKRLARLRENVDRLGLGAPGGARVEIAAGDARTLPPVPSDAVLVDAPCSGLGVLARHPELRWTKGEEDVARLAKIQASLLDAAAEWVKPGGRLVYATCSVLREENEAVVEEFLARRPEFRGASIPEALSEVAAPGPGGMRVLRTWPHRHEIDGAFAALLLRSPA